MDRGYRQDERERARFEAGIPARRQPHFGSDNNSSSNSNNQQHLAPVIPHLTNKYDPEHPDADWGGIVQRSYKKRFFDAHVSTKDSLAYDDKGGLMPDRSAAVANNNGRKLFEPHQAPSGDPSVPGVPFQSAVYQVGPGCDASSNDWKTTYASQTLMEATPKDVYALGTRQNSQHRRHVAPLYEKALAERKNTGRSASPLSDDGSLGSSSSSGSLSGRRVDSRRSLLAGIGKLVAAEDLGDKLPTPELHLAQSYADPSQKTLLAENHHGVKLGYTGRRNPSRF